MKQRWVTGACANSLVTLPIGGHYVAYAKNSNFNLWFKFDDFEVSEGVCR